MSDSAAVREGLQAVSRRGWRAAVLLAVLTVLEYVIAVNIDSPLIWLLPFVAAKGWIILDTFMHLRAVLPGGHH